MSQESLFLCHRLPFPPNKGDKIRSHAILTHLAQLGPVHVGSFVDDKDDLQYCDAVRALAGGETRLITLGKTSKWSRAAQALVLGQPITTAYFGSQSLSRWVDKIMSTRPIDNIVIFGSAMAPYFLRRSSTRGQVLFDMVDVDSDKWQQYGATARGLERWIYGREARTLETLEKKAASQFGKTLLVSPFEAETFRKIAADDAGKIDSLSNGVDLARFSPGDFENPFASDELPIVMTGRMDYRPNFHGAEWFAKAVAPRVFSQLPRAHVYFVGSNPPSSLRQLNSAQITVTGNVADVRPYLQHAAAVIAPLLMARGVQNKVLEAMAMQKPIVATLEATRALAVTSGEHLWVENDPLRFADAVVAAVEGPDRATVAANGRRFVVEHHDWTKLLAELDHHLAQLKVPQRAPVSVGPAQPRHWHEAQA